MFGGMEWFWFSSVSSSLPVSVRLRSPHLFTLLIVSYRLPLLQSSFTFHQDIKDHKRKKVNE